MTEMQSNAGQLVPGAASLAVPVKIGAELSEAVQRELVRLAAAQQDEFVKAYQRQSCSLLLAYLASLIYCHYGLLGRWVMTGVMLLTLFVAVTLGWVWWLIDVFRMPGMVRSHNQRVAAEILRQLSPPGGPAPLARV